MNETHGSKQWPKNLGWMIPKSQSLRIQSLLILELMLSIF